MRELSTQTECEDAGGVSRGVMRMFARQQIFALSEMPLRNHRRADLMGLDAGNQVVIVEIKCSRADLMGDRKWREYLDYCDRFYWAIPNTLDAALLDRQEFAPERCGLIVADAYDAMIVRSSALHKLAPARRKVECGRLARHAMRRLAQGADPEIMLEAMPLD